MGNGIVWTDSLTLSAFDTFLLINIGLPVYHRNGSSGTNLIAGMCHTPHTFVSHFISVDRTGIAGGRNDLHQRGFVIFFVNITLFQSLCHMYRHIFRSKAHTHSQPQSLTDNGSLSVHTLPVCGFRVVYYLIRKRLHIVNQIVRMICQTGNLPENSPSDFSHLCIDSSHKRLPL